MLCRKNIVIPLLCFSFMYFFLGCSNKEEEHEFPLTRIPGRYTCYVTRHVSIDDYSAYEDRDTITAIVWMNNGNYEINFGTLNFEAYEDSAIYIPKLTANIPKLIVTITGYDFNQYWDIDYAYFTYQKTGEFEHGCSFNRQCKDYFEKFYNDWMAFELHLKCDSSDNKYFLVMRGIYWISS